MAAFSVTPVFPRALYSPSRTDQCGFLRKCDALKLTVHCSPMNFSERKLRRIVAFAVSGNAEGSFKKTLQIDRLIDLLRDANDKELPQLVAENILSFNEGFWIRLAARTDTCKSDDDKRDYEELAASVMSVVDRIVHKTNEKIESATDVLKAILKPVVDGVEEICWPPRDPEALNIMKKELNQREQEGQLDEGFLSEVSAQLRQAKDDGDKPGLEAMLQKVLQLYASQSLSKRSYSKKGNEVLRDEQLLETLIAVISGHIFGDNKIELLPMQLHKKSGIRC